MGLQSRIIFDKNIVFRHLQTPKMAQDSAHMATKMRFEILHLADAFLVRSETTFGSVPEIWNYTDCKNQDFLFFKKIQIKYVLKIFYISEK